MRRAMFLGSAIHNVDAKGRVFIPSKFRTEMGVSLVLCQSPDGCVRAYTPEVWNEFAKKLDATGANMLLLRRLLFASAEQVELDSQGRVLLPEGLRTQSGITEKVRIVGLNSWMEFWNPEKYKEATDTGGVDMMKLYQEAGLS